MKRLAINLICTGSNTKNSIRHSQNALNDVCQRARGKLNSRPNQFGQRNHGDYPHQLTLNLTKQLRRPNCTRSMHLASLRSRNAEVCEWRGTVFFFYFFLLFCCRAFIRPPPHLASIFFCARVSVECATQPTTMHIFNKSLAFECSKMLQSSNMAEEREKNYGSYGPLIIRYRLLYNITDSYRCIFCIPCLCFNGTCLSKDSFNFLIW